MSPKHKLSIAAVLLADFVALLCWKLRDVEAPATREFEVGTQALEVVLSR